MDAFDIIVIGVLAVLVTLIVIVAKQQFYTMKLKEWFILDVLGKRKKYYKVGTKVMYVGDEWTIVDVDYFVTRPYRIQREKVFLWESTYYRWMRGDDITPVKRIICGGE